MHDNCKTLLWFWGRKGSGALHCLQLVEKFYEAGTLQDLVISISRDGETLNLLQTLPYFDTLKIEFVETNSALRSSFAFFKAIPRLRRRFKKLLNGYNIGKIIVPMSFAVCPAVIDIAKALNIPIIYFLHDISAHKGDPTGFIHAIPQRWILKNANNIICLSEHVHSEFKQIYPNMRSKVLPLISLYKNVSTHKQHAHPVKFLMMGRMLQYKNLTDVLAAAKILEQNPNFVLTVAGDMDSTQLQPLHPNIQFISKWLSFSEIDSLYKEHHILIANYTHASQSGPVAQAISNGMPCIVSNVGALPEQIAHGKMGWILAETSAECLKNTVLNVIHNAQEFETKSTQCVEEMAQHSTVTFFDL